MFEVLSGITSVLGGLGGLFGRKKDPTPAQNLMSQAQGARQAAKAYGFNPLTMMQYGQAGGAMGGGGSSPLASIDLITGGLSGLDDVFSGDRARRDAREKLDYDLKKLQLDTLRSGVVSVGPSGTDRVGTGRSPLGGRAVSVAGAGAPSDDRTAIMIGGGVTSPNLGWSDADEAEKRYSEVGGNLMGLSNIFADIKTTAQKHSQSRMLRDGHLVAPLSHPKFVPSASTPIAQIPTRPKPRGNKKGSASRPFFDFNGFFN